ncbi:MAG: SMC-Scp complex subunit ScpB [Bacteroidota bacterium]
MERLAQQIESLVFAATEPMPLEDIQAVLTEAFGLEIPAEELQQAVQELKARYSHDDFSFELLEIGGGLRFMTKGAYHHTIGTYLRQTTSKRLSRSALETLSIIAYKQPVTKSELEKIRGVSCDYAIQKLLEKELVSIVGRADTVGKPLLYATSAKFMDYFGINSVEDLPQPKDFKLPENVIGDQAGIEEE